MLIEKIGRVSQPQSSGGCIRMTEGNFLHLIYTQYHGCKDTDEHHAADLLDARGVHCRVGAEGLGADRWKRVCVKNKQATLRRQMVRSRSTP